MNKQTSIDLKNNTITDYIEVENPSGVKCREWLSNVQSFIKDIEPKYSSLTFSLEDCYSMTIEGQRPATQSEIALALDLQASRCLKFLERNLSGAETDLAIINGVTEVQETQPRMMAFYYKDVLGQESKDNYVSNLEKRIKTLKEVKAQGPVAIVDYMTREETPWLTRVFLG